MAFTFFTLAPIFFLSLSLLSFLISFIFFCFTLSRVMAGSRFSFFFNFFVSFFLFFLLSLEELLDEPDDEPEEDDDEDDEDSERILLILFLSSSS